MFDILFDILIYISNWNIYIDILVDIFQKSKFPSGKGKVHTRNLWLSFWTWLASYAIYADGSAFIKLNLSTWQVNTRLWAKRFLFITKK